MQYASLAYRGWTLLPWSERTDERKDALMKDCEWMLINTN